jgi:GntR family transcriptional regulator
MVLRPLKSSLGVPLYLQFMEQVKHAIEIGALRPGDQLPAIRRVAHELVMNPNTVVRAYRELEHQGVIEVVHGLGAFVSETVANRTKVLQKARPIVQSAVDRLRSIGLTDEEIRRMVDTEVSAGKELEGMR